jgi:hypothetical protein
VVAQREQLPVGAAEAVPATQVNIYPAAQRLQIALGEVMAALVPETAAAAAAHDVHPAAVAAGVQSEAAVKIGVAIAERAKMKMMVFI